jgi:hypothetical protein
MKNTTTRTALRLLVATPLAAGAIAFGGGVAHADGGFEPDGPIVIAQPDGNGPKGPGEIANPEPAPQPDPPAPKPQGPGDIAQPEGEGEDPQPHGPGDFTNPEGDDDPQPHGPGDLTSPEGDDDPQGPDDLAIPEPGDQPEDEPADKGNKGDEDLDVANGGGLVAADVPVPNRIDAGAGSATTDEEGNGLVWLLAGGGAVTAAGSVLARQRLARRTR